MAMEDKDGRLHSQKDGRFVSKNGDKSSVKKDYKKISDSLKAFRDRRKAIEFAQGNTAISKKESLKKLNFFSKNRKKHLYTRNVEETFEPPKEIQGFKNTERNRTRHHQRHIFELGFENENDYIKGAQNFWEKGAGKIYRGRVRRGTFCKYNEKTGEYLVIDKEGVLLTFYQITAKQFKRYEIQERYEYVKG